MGNKHIQSSNKKKVALILAPCISTTYMIDWKEYPSTMFLSSYLQKNGIICDEVNFNSFLLNDRVEDAVLQEEFELTKKELKSLSKDGFIPDSEIDYYLTGFHYFKWLKRLKAAKVEKGAKLLDDLDTKGGLFKDDAFYFLVSKYDIFRRKCNLNNDKSIFEDIDPHFIKELESYFSKLLTQNSLAEKYNFYAISIPSILHYPYALILSKVIKQKNKDSYVCVGGPAVNLTDFSDLDWFRKQGYFDDYFVGNSEKKLLHKIKELIKSENSILTDSTHYNPDSMPDINAPWVINEQILMFPPERQIQKKEAMLIVSQGCYWNKCSFCDYCHLYKSPQIKKINVLIDEMVYLDKSFGIKKFALNTESLPPEYAKELSEELMQRKLKYTWIPIFMRIDLNYTPKIFKLMKLAGCDSSNTTIGVESFCDDELKFLNKPYRRKEILLFFENAKKAGISFGQINFISDAPGVTFKESMEGIGIMKKNISLFRDLACSNFSLTSTSNLMKKGGHDLLIIDNSKKPKKEYIRKFDSINHCKLYCNVVSFINKSGMTREEQEKVEQEYEVLFTLYKVFDNYPSLDRVSFVKFSDGNLGDMDLFLKTSKDMITVETNSRSLKVPNEGFFINTFFLKNFDRIRFIEPGKEYSFSEIVHENLSNGNMTKDQIYELRNFIIFLLSKKYFVAARLDSIK